MKAFVNALSACLLLSLGELASTVYAAKKTAEEDPAVDPVVEEEEGVETPKEPEEKREPRRADLFKNREDIGIYLNKYVDRLTQVWDESDQLSLFYILHSDKVIDDSGQDWTTLDRMFIKVLEELKGGYVTTYAVDCADEHPNIEEGIALKKICENDPW